MQEIVLTALPEEESPCRLELISPFVGVLAEKLPKVCVSFRKEDLIERGFSAQLHSLLPVDSSYSKSILQQLYDFVPASTYNLDEYVRFRTVRDVLWNLSREYVSVSWKVKMSSGYCNRI